MSEMQEKKFGYVVHPPHHHCFPPPPGPIPPGMSVKDWTDYINSYIDVRARQIYDKLKRLIPEGGGSGGGVQSVTYEEKSGLGDNFEIGKLKVDGNSTPIHVPVIGLDALPEENFQKAKKVLTIHGVGDNGEDVDVFCEEPDGYVYDEILLRDQNDNQVYKVYINDGTLESVREEQ